MTRTGSLVILVLLAVTPALPKDGRTVSAQSTEDLWRLLVAIESPFTGMTVEQGSTAGDVAEAIADIARLTRDDLNDVLASVSDIPMPERSAVVRRALLLHTAAAIAARDADRGDPSQATTGTRSFYVDGQPVGTEAASLTWDFTRRLIERLPAGPDRTTIAQRFYRATGGLLAWWASHVELDAHVQAARQILPDDPIFLLYAGARYQLYAHPRATVLFEERRRAIALGPVERRRGVPPLPSIEAARRDAERALRHAVRLGPDLVEARVRLAHVLLDRGHADEAVTLLEGIDEVALSRPLAYYAHIVGGLALRQLDRPDGARTAFSAATELYSRAQTPRLLLSELALHLGDRADARRQLSILAAVRTDGDDPWVWLPRWHANAQADLDALFAEFAE